MSMPSLIGTLLVGGLLVGLIALPACHRHRTPTERADWMTGKIAKELNLNDEQKVKLNALKLELLAARTQVTSEREAVADELMTQVRADHLDEAKLLGIFEQHQALKARVAPGIIAKAATFHASLTPEQKAEAAEHLKHFRERMQSRHHDDKM